MYPDGVQEQVLAKHADLYRLHEAGFATLKICEGKLNLQSVNDAPFGCGVDLEVSQFPPLKTWIMSGGLGMF